MLLILKDTQDVFDWMIKCHDKFDNMPIVQPESENIELSISQEWLNRPMVLKQFKIGEGIEFKGQINIISYSDPFVYAIVPYGEMVEEDDEINRLENEVAKFSNNIQCLLGGCVYNDEKGSCTLSNPRMQIKSVKGISNKCLSFEL